MVIFMELSDQWSWKSTFLKIISGEMDPTSGHPFRNRKTYVGLSKHNMFDEHVLETVIMGTKHYIPSKWTSSI
jgi:ATPase subunit of ABC transporter with duplicated ATPase domains